eukprot:5421730-Prymnesium_polylepis.1
MAAPLAHGGRNVDRRAGARTSRRPAALYFTHAFTRFLTHSFTPASRGDRERRPRGHSTYSTRTRTRSNVLQPIRRVKGAVPRAARRLERAHDLPSQPLRAYLLAQRHVHL